MERRPGRDRLPAAQVASLCQDLHRILLRIHSSFDVPEAVDMIAQALATTSGLAAVAVLVEDGQRRTLVGGYNLLGSFDVTVAGDRPIPDDLTTQDDQHCREVGAVAAALDSGAKLRIVAYGCTALAGSFDSEAWLEVVQPTLVLAMRLAQQSLSLTQSSVELEAEVERRTREIVRLSENERALLERLQAQTDELQVANAELRQLDLTKTAIISGVSHELRTPISTIKTLARLLAKPELPPEKHRQYLEVIQTECDRQNALVSDLLELARLESGVTPLDRSNQNLAVAAGLVVHHQREAIAAAGQSLIVELPDDETPVLWAHPSELEQIIGNLLSNAHKFTDAGGTITLSITQTSTEVRLIVRDTGIGIPEALSERVFDTFYRVPHQDRQVPGTGLGLAIVHRLVASLGGRISLVSAEGVGSEFTVTWPRR